jgi:non-ribosomal peptide synthetase component F
VRVGEPVVLDDLWREHRQWRRRFVQKYKQRVSVSASAVDSVTINNIYDNDAPSPADSGDAVNIHDNDAAAAALRFEAAAAADSELQCIYRRITSRVDAALEKLDMEEKAAREAAAARRRSQAD